MTPEAFTNLIATVTARIQGSACNDELERNLNKFFPANGADFRALVDACHSAIAAGWMCNRGSKGLKFGRVLKPGPQTHGFSVDVVDMDSIVGPHHRHPNGEIDLIMPTSPGAQFDGRGAGWLVYGPGSAHYPIVTGGRALVLYLLPGGAIEFTKT